VTVSESPTDERFSRLRDQLWFALRDFIRGGGALPDDLALVAELVGPTYRFDIRGRIKVESKDEMKARLDNHRSPDRADAMALAIFQMKTFKVSTSPSTFLDY
jgi:phage terminase large subunit